MSLVATVMPTAYDIPRPSREAVLELESWYHGMLTRLQSECLVRSEGDFLVRDSISFKGDFVLTVFWNGRAVHFQINKHSSSFSSSGFFFQFEEEQFENVLDLVTFYQAHSKPITRNSGCVIKNPVPNTAFASRNFNPQPEIDQNYMKILRPFKFDQERSLTQKVLLNETRKRWQSKAAAQLLLPSSSVPSYRKPYFPLSDLLSRPLPKPIQSPVKEDQDEYSEIDYGSIEETTTSALIIPNETLALRRDEVPDASTLTICQRQNYKLSLTLLNSMRHKLLASSSVLPLTSSTSFIDVSKLHWRIPRSDSFPILPKRKVPFPIRDSGCIADNSDYDRPNPHTTVSTNTAIGLRNCRLPFIALNNKTQTEQLEKFRQLLLTKKPESCAQLITAEDYRLLRLEENLQVPLKKDAANFKRLNGLSLILLPHGQNVRNDLLERNRSLHYLCILSILHQAQSAQRCAIYDAWVQIAHALFYRCGNAFSFLTLLDALCSDLVKSVPIEERSRTLQQQLGSVARKLYHCEPLPPNYPQINIPFMQPLLSILSNNSCPLDDAGNGTMSTAEVDNLWKWLQEGRHWVKKAVQLGANSSNACSEEISHGGNEEFCCDEKQVALLDAQMTLPRQFLARCPSCLRNFIQLWCDFTCSPNQANFVRVISSTNDLYLMENSTEYVTEVAYYVRDSYADGLFQSCKDVRAIGTDYALSFMCGVSISECDISQWFAFMGTYNEDIGVPFQITFIPSPSFSKSTQEDQLNVSNTTIVGINPPTTRVFFCSEAVHPNGSPCSCQDCPQSCVAESPFPFIAQEECQVASFDCMLILSLFGFGGLCFAVFFFAIMHYSLKRSQDGDLSDFKPAGGTLDDTDLGTIDTLGSWIESQLELICAHYGQLCVKRPLAVFAFGTLVAILCSSGMLFVRFTTDPVELWSSWTSRARGEKYFFDNEFGPFYRMEQLIVYPRDQSFWLHENQSDLFEPGFYGPALRKTFLQQVAELQEAVTGLIAVTEDGTPVSLTDVCYKPMTPDNQNCAIMTVLNYFQNNMTLLNQTTVDEWSGSQFDYLDHIMTCAQNPYQTTTRLGIPCLSAFGVPIQPYVVLGEFNSSNQWDSARGIVITILLNNHITAVKNKYAAAWEKVFALYLRNISHQNYAISFMAERSIQDEIDRESQSDIFTILISYIFMFAYVAFALGQYQVTGNNLATLLVHSKVMLGVAGVMIVALSVTSSIGLYAFYGIPATTIVLEVQPFLVLAVGVDNIFIFVQAYQRAEEPLTEPLYLRISHISGEVIPSMLLSSLSECLCFFVGALSSMPAVKVFSLYAALAIFFNFFLQITCFLAIFILDVRREEDGRPEVCCCRRITTVESVNNDGYMLYLFSNYYAPFLLSKYVRIIVIFLFAGWLSSSFAVMGNIPLGFDQKMAVPEDSYVFSYFKSMDRFLSVGPPVYFVIKGDMEFSDPYEHNKICSGAGCATDSLGAQIAHAARWSNRSYIAYPAMNWLDDYFDWVQPYGDPPCCRLFLNGTFCSSTENSESCIPCNVEFVDGRPRSDLFYHHLTHFLSNNPSIKCVKGGHAAYGSAVKLSRRGRVLSSHFMTYHTVLKTSSDFINAMTSARRIAANITAMLNKDRDGRCPVEVFPYSVFYVFYEQYTTIVMDACIQLVLSLVAIFAVTTVLLGLDPWSAFIIDFTISCVLFNLIGLMYWWSIDFNAISVVNLVMTVGISVEFCAHIVRSFSLSVHRDRLMRARHSLASMGSSVLSGITLTKFGGILVLAFAHSQIFKVFYFRMFLGIVLIGAAHGLIFLPVLLSYIGPPMNKRKLIMKTRSESCCINDCGATVTKTCLTKHCDPSPLTDVF